MHRFLYHCPRVVKEFCRLLFNMQKHLAESILLEIETLTCEFPAE